jgi:type IX secretion system substrate protein/uncharacterized protein DUF4886
MRRMIILLVLFTCIKLSFSQIPTGTNNYHILVNSDQDTSKILFLGSSYFNYNDLPGLLKSLADSSGKEVYIDQYIPSGIYLSDHASSSVSEAKINERNWDYVILQGVGVLTAYPDTFTDHPVFPALDTLQRKISANYEGTKMIFCLPWAFEDGMTWYGWPDTYSDMQIKAHDNTIQYSNELNFPIAPVGWAWYKVLEEKHYPLHYLHMSDWNHPSLNGSYLMACAIFTTIFQESTEGNPYYAGIQEDEAYYFQTIASNTVLDSLEHWNISTSTGLNETSITDNFILHQNYPNPFSSATIINYEVRERSFVRIVIYDIFGKLQTVLVEQYKKPGSYSVCFNGIKIESGIYLCQIVVDSKHQLKKMILIK